MVFDDVGKCQIRSGSAGRIQRGNVFARGGDVGARSAGIRLTLGQPDREVADRLLRTILR